MFNSITGELRFKDTERVFLQTGGLEWDILSSRTSINRLPEPGETVTIFVHLYHREDQLKLYGFATPAEKHLFLDLLKVQGIGPKQAVKILSGIKVMHFVEALESEDIDALSSLPGIGKKTAQNILLKLKGKLTVRAGAGISLEEDLVNALNGMGFERRTAVTAVKAAVRKLGPAKDGLSREELERELFKKAIAQLSSQDGNK